MKRFRGQRLPASLTIVSRFQSFAPIQNLIAELNQKQAINARKPSFESQGKAQSSPLIRTPPPLLRIQTTSAAPVTQPPTPFQARASDSSDLKFASSQDSRRSQNDVHFESEKPTPKPLSIEYEPPFLYPIYNENYTKEIERNVNTASTRFVPTATTTTRTTTTTVPFFTRKATKFFSTRVTTPPPPTATTTTSRPASPSGFVDRKNANFFDGRFSTRPAQLSSTTPPATVPLNSLLSTPKPFAPVASPSDYPEPPTGLLPPFETFVYHDDATTQGPPIYFEWKIPASGLEPPLVDDSHLSPEDNQVPVIPPEQAKPAVQIPLIEKDLVPPLFEGASNQLAQAGAPDLNLQPPSLAAPPTSNDTDTAASNHSFTSVLSTNEALQSFSHATIAEKSQTQRSVSSSTGQQNSVQSTKEVNYVDLQKQFSIPEYTFPLETVSRPGYQNSDAVNSFLVKIPDSGDGDKRKKWYGENAKCPECHPSFLKPGTCEPCIKFR